MKDKRLDDFLKLAGSIALCQAAGFIGSIFTTASIPTWYASLNKPFFTPPSWVFMPVWLALYTMMGVSMFIILRRGISYKGVKIALFPFALQLILNALWSIIFFGFKSPAAGFVAIAFLWLFIAWTIMAFSKISRISAILLVPYLIWVSLAALLNLAIMILN